MNALVRMAIGGCLWCALGTLAPAQVAVLPPAGYAAPLPWAPVRPSDYLAYGPYDLLGGYARAYITAPQPVGHEIIPTGPNGYVYRPVYQTPATNVLVPPAPPRTSYAPSTPSSPRAPLLRKFGDAIRSQPTVEQLPSPRIAPGPREF